MARGTIITRTVTKTLDDGRKRKEQRYDTVIRIGGKQKWKTFERKKEAEEYLDRHTTDVRNGTYREIKKATFGQFIEQWKATHLILGTVDENGFLTAKRLKPSTIRGYRTIVDTYLIPEFEHVQMQAIDSEKITAFESKLLQRKKFSNKSIHNALTLFGRILDDARKGGYLKFSPMADVEKTRFVCAKGRALKPEEAQKFLAKCAGDLKLIVMICLLAGLRRAELFALRWIDVDFEHDQIRVRQSVEWLSRKNGQVADDKKQAFVFQAPKYHSIRSVDLSPMLKVELRKQYMQAADKEGLIFQTREGTPLNPSNVFNRMFKPAVVAAEIGKLKMHDLRHTFGSWKIEQGENILYVSKQMGHKDASITLKVYSHLVKESRPEAAAKTDSFLSGSTATVASTTNADQGRRSSTSVVVN